MNDILLDSDFDISFEDGDFKTGDDTEQRVMLILDSAPGNWKQWPTIGVGIRGLLNGRVTPQLSRNIQLQLASDNLKFEAASYTSGQLDIRLKK